MFNLEAIEVDKNDFNQQLGYILKLDGYTRNNITAPTLFDEPMIVFNDLSDEDLDNILNILKINSIKIPYKAVTTEHNINWTANYLLEHIKEEIKAIEQKRNK